MNGGDVSVSESDDPLLPVVRYDEPLERQSVGQHLRTIIFTPKNCYIALGPLLCAVVCLCARLGGEEHARRSCLDVCLVVDGGCSDADHLHGGG